MDGFPSGLGQDDRARARRGRSGRKTGPSKEQNEGCGKAILKRAVHGPVLSHLMHFAHTPPDIAYRSNIRIRITLWVHSGEEEVDPFRVEGQGLNTFGSFLVQASKSPPIQTPSRCTVCHAKTQSSHAFSLPYIARLLFPSTNRDSLHVSCSRSHKIPIWKRSLGMEAKPPARWFGMRKGNQGRSLFRYQYEITRRAAPM